MPFEVSPVWNFCRGTEATSRSAGRSTRKAYGTRRCTPFPESTMKPEFIPVPAVPLAVTDTGKPVKPAGASITVPGTVIWTPVV